MKKELWLVLAVCLPLGGCDQETQDVNMVLYEWQAHEMRPLPDIRYSRTVTVGPESKQVPVNIAWAAGLGADGCLRIAEIEVERAGGDSTVVISKVNHSPIPDCVMNAMGPESSDTTRFEIAYINMKYKTRAGAKSYVYDGGIAAIKGNGEFQDQTE